MTQHVELFAAPLTGEVTSRDRLPLGCGERLPGALNAGLREALSLSFVLHFAVIYVPFLQSAFSIFSTLFKTKATVRTTRCANVSAKCRS